MLSKSIHCYDSHRAAGPSIVTSVALLVPAVRWRRDSTIVPSKIVRRPGFVLLCQHAVLARMSEQKIGQRYICILERWRGETHC